MLVVDGAKFELWTPGSEEEFEKVFSDNISNIFGKDSIYIDLKHKLASRSGTGSIPDGYVITPDNPPQIHIVELELASHSLQHIVAQIIAICNGIGNPVTQQKICDRIEDEISKDEFFKLQIEKAIKPRSIRRFLSDCFSGSLVMVCIVIDQISSQLEEALGKISHPYKIIEFQTFRRIGAESIHAHVFKPLIKQEEFEKREVGRKGDGKADFAQGREPTVGILYLKIKNLIAKGGRTQNGFMVFKGSQAVSENRHSAPPAFVNRRQELLKSGKLIHRKDFLEFAEDVEFGSPSVAGGIVTGGSTNGLIAWKNENGITLKNLENP